MVPSGRIELPSDPYQGSVLTVKLPERTFQPHGIFTISMPSSQEYSLQLLDTIYHQ